MHESEERLQLNRPLFEQPGQRHGAAQPRPYAPKAWARRDQRLPGRSLRAERKEQETQAAAKATPVTLDMFKAFTSRAELDRRRAVGEARDVTRRLVDEGRPTGVWQMESWTDGGKPCPDERLEWRDA